MRAVLQLHTAEQTTQMLMCTGVRVHRHQYSSSVGKELTRSAPAAGISAQHREPRWNWTLLFCSQWWCMDGSPGGHLAEACYRNDTTDSHLRGIIWCFPPAGNATGGWKVREQWACIAEVCYKSLRSKGWVAYLFSKAYHTIFNALSSVEIPRNAEWGTSE